jgi:hypothetical protein
MRWRGLAQSRGTVPPISQRPLRRSTTYQGQERSRCSGRPDHRVARGSPRRGLRIPLCQRAGVSPKPGGAKCSLSQWLRAFFSPNDRGFPQAKRLKYSLRRVAQSFLLITRLKGCPSAAQFEVFPSPTAQSFLLRTPLGVAPPPRTLKFSLRRWLEVPPCGFPSCRVAPDFPRDQRPQSLPNTGWPGVSPAPVARSFLLTGGAGLLLARKPGVVLCRVARGFPFAGYRPWW